MTITELITELQCLKCAVGDLPVVWWEDGPRMAHPVLRVGTVGDDATPTAVTIAPNHAPGDALLESLMAEHPETVIRRDSAGNYHLEANGRELASLYQDSAWHIDAGDSLATISPDAVDVVAARYTSTRKGGEA